MNAEDQARSEFFPAFQACVLSVVPVSSMPSIPRDFTAKTELASERIPS